MLTIEYLSPYSLLTGQYLGVIRTIVSNNKTTKESAIEDFDIFDDLDETIVFEASKQSATVKINNVVVGEVDLPVSEVDVYVNVANPSIPFIKNPKEFIHSAAVIANSIVTNPGESLHIMIDQSHVRSKYGEQEAAFTIEVINVEQGEKANVESMINVESYFTAIASSYISKVYGVKMEQNILEKTKEIAEKTREKIVEGWEKLQVEAKEKVKDMVLTTEEKRILQDPFVKVYMKIRDIIERFIQEVITFFGKLKAELSQILSKIESQVESIVKPIKDFVSHYPIIVTAVATASIVGIITLIMKKIAVRVAAREFASIPNDKLTYAVLDDIASVLIVTNPTLDVKQVAKEAVSIFEQAGKKGINNYKKLASKFVSKEASVKVSQRKANPGIIPALVGILKAATPVVGAGIFGFIIGLLTVLNTDKIVEAAKQVQDTAANIEQKSGEVVEKIGGEVKQTAGDVAEKVQTTGKSLIEKLQQVYSDIPTFAKVGVAGLIGVGVILVGAKILQTLRKRRIVSTSMDINKVKQDVKNMNNRVFAFAYASK
jgi:xanthosine utilization system XapX-like protein/predicted transcriptional regulator